NDVQGKLIDNADGTLGGLDALLPLDDIETLSIADQREKRPQFFLSRFSEHLPNFLRCRLTVEIRHHRPGIKYDDLTCGLSHAAALVFVSAFEPLTTIGLLP